MTKVLIVYCSMTGNTEEMAFSIEAGLQQLNNLEVTLLDSFDPFPDNLESYNYLLIGSYTDGDGEIPFGLMDFFDEIAEIDLAGKIVGLFGSGDKLYDYFCGALNEFETMLKNNGAHLPLPSFKVELEPSKEELEECVQFANKLITFTPLAPKK